MAGIFSRGFGFPSTSLAAAAEATAKGSAGSRAGAGPRPTRRPPPAEGEKKNPRVGEPAANPQARLRDGAEDWLRSSAGPTWTDAAAGFHAPPGRPVQGIWAFRGCSLLRFSSWEAEAWTPILTCHCISEVRRPLWKRNRGDGRLQLQEVAGVSGRG